MKFLIQFYISSVSFVAKYVNITLFVSVNNFYSENNNIVIPYRMYTFLWRSLFLYSFVLKSRR